MKQFLKQLPKSRKSLIIAKTAGNDNVFSEEIVEIIIEKAKSINCPIIIDIVYINHWTDERKILCISWVENDQLNFEHIIIQYNKEGE